ncbi:Thioredoxin-like protein [anaerobic digester metagenome]
MKSNLIVALFFSLMLFTSNVKAQERTIEVPMELIEGKDFAVGMYPGMMIVKDKSAFTFPVDSSRCVTGFFYITGYYDYYQKALENDSIRKEFDNDVKKSEVDTMQFLNNNLKSNRIFCCSWLDGKIKNVVLDTDGDSSFADEKVITYNTENGFCEWLDSSSATAVVDVMLTYDSLNISKQKSIPVLVVLNIEDFGGIQDSLGVAISINKYLKGSCIIDGVKTEIFMDADNFDQIYFPHYNLGYYQCEYYDRKSSYFLLDTLYIYNSRYVVDRYECSTRKLILRYDKEMKAGIEPGDYFPISPGLEEINNYTLVFFTATWCGLCKNVLDSLKKFHTLVPEVDIVNINTELDSARMNNYIKWNNVEWNVIFDQKIQGKKSNYWKTYGVGGIPQLVLVDYNRTVLLSGGGSGIGEDSCETLIGKILEHGPDYFDRTRQ